jgi:hypothetical protein
MFALGTTEAARHLQKVQELKRKENQTGANGDALPHAAPSTEFDLHHEPAFGTEDTRVYPTERSSDDDERIEPAGNILISSSFRTCN